MRRPRPRCRDGGGEVMDHETVVYIMACMVMFAAGMKCGFILKVWLDDRAEWNRSHEKP